MEHEKHDTIRVLHVLTAMNRAGVETMLMNLYRFTERERVQFDFAVSASARCDYDEEILSLGGKIFRYPRYTVKNHFAYRAWWERFFRSHPEYRIVHGHIGSTASIYLKIAKRCGCITIAHSHSTGGKSVHDVLYKLYSFPTRYIADYFFGCSEAALISRYGYSVAGQPEISRVLKNGIDAARYECTPAACGEARAALGLGADDFVLGTVGRFTEAKNCFFLVDILEALKREAPDFCFLWAGTGELAGRVEALIDDRGLRENVRLLGVRDDVPRLLQAMNVFLLPSKYEGLPVIGVEVQAAGVPMLCSDRVSPELKLGGGVRFLPIDNVKPWVVGILQEKTFRRIPNAAETVRLAGYDVRTTSAWLTEFYETHC